MASSEAMTSTPSFVYSYRQVKKCFVEISETWKYHNFLIFQPIFFFLTVLFEEFYSFFWNQFKLGLDFPFNATV